MISEEALILHQILQLIAHQDRYHEAILDRKKMVGRIEDMIERCQA